MATQVPPPGKPPGGKSGTHQGPASQRDVELLKVVVAREGQKVSAQWAIHPQIKHDLKPAELKEITDLMAKVTGIVGTRFAQVLADAEPDKPGTA
jgi:5,10-methylenetetrahydrofolate reductase